MAFRKMNPGLKTFLVRHAIASLFVGLLFVCLSLVPTQLWHSAGEMGRLAFGGEKPALRAGPELDEFDRPLIAIGRRLTEVNTTCVSNSQCGHGRCSPVNDGPLITYQCVCESGWINRDGQVCSYEQKEKLTGFLLSFFVGYLGVDWFYLAAGVSLYVGLGVLKLLTCGGCCVWALADWIRILCNTFPDGNGVALKQW